MRQLSTLRVSLRRGEALPPTRKEPSSMASIAPCPRGSSDVPDEDRVVMTITEHDEDNFSYSKNYLGIARGDDLVMIQLTVNNTRTVEKKRALYRAIVENLTADPGLRGEDILINLIEVLPENWSFGNGIAQYAPDKG